MSELEKYYPLIFLNVSVHAEKLNRLDAMQFLTLKEEAYNHLLSVFAWLMI